MVGCGVVVEFSAGESDAFSEAEEAESRCRWLCNCRGGWGVVDADVEFVARCSFEGDVYVCAWGVFGGVGQSFLDDPVAGSSDGFGRLSRHAGGERDVQSGCAGVSYQVGDPVEGGLWWFRAARVGPEHAEDIP